MTDVADDLEKLLSDVRKTISDNRQFLENLVDETVGDDTTRDDAEATVPGDDFEEL